MATTAQSVMERITEAISRGKGRFGLGAITGAQAVLAPGSKYSLMVGACQIVRVRAKTTQGFVAAVSMNREQIQELRDQCDEALKALEGS